MNPPKKDPGKDPKILALEGQVAELTTQLKKLTDLAGRAQADLQNAKIRMEKDRDDLGKFATESVLKKLLPVIDHFQRAFQHLPEDLKDHEWVKGVAAIEQDFTRLLSELGLRKIESLGADVDTAKHEVLTIGPGEEGKILEVFEEGYELNGRVLRPAKVKVGDGMMEEARNKSQDTK
ncbi:nucleotide exchange factor GrpE [Candidatus Peregrinibacteria bacterium]|nr:nucleotide exchange factor GrpE [Candidatus Peregrinibacteria bacterium]